MGSAELNFRGINIHKIFDYVYTLLLKFFYSILIT